MTTEAKASLTIAGSDLPWLMAVVQSAGHAFTTTVVHCADVVGSATIAESDNRTCAIVELTQDASAPDVRQLLDRSPGVRFVFVAEQLPLRHAVASVIRERGHTVLSRGDSPVVIIATSAALLAGA